MNDSHEFRYASDYLTEVTKNIIKSLWDGHKPTEEANAIINFCGGFEKFVEIEAKNLLALVYEGSFFRTVGDVYITSFCDYQDEELNKDGLLSQWRGYGKEQGYAIEFDEKKISDLLLETGGNNLTSLVNENSKPSIKKVKYTRNFKGFETYFKEDIEKIKPLFKTFYEGLISGKRDDKSLESTFESALNGLCEISSRCKHFGFHEEGELRIVLIVKKEKNEDGKVSNLHKIHTRRTENGTLRSYIELFNDCSIPLSKAINRILVGPSKHKDNNKEKLETMIRELGEGYKHIKVDVSTIPFV
jgi:hypothetical protein